MKKWSTGKKTTACCSINQVNNKGPWTEQEDKKLINLVEKYGAEKWSFISSHFPERIGKQCRERWFNHLCPTVNKTAWSKEEEWILFILHNQIGNKWSQLCKYLPGRTDNTIKNHWNSTMKKRIEQLQMEYDNMINGKTEEEINKINDDILKKCKIVVEEENQKFYDEKMKNYEKFKNITIDNKQSMYKLKKILLFRTHSKKIKRRGRKKKFSSNEERSISSIKNYIVNNTTSNSVNCKSKKISQFKLSDKKEKKETKSKKRFGTPKIKKNIIKRKIGEQFIGENNEFSKKINLINSPIHKFIINKNDYIETVKNENHKINDNNINISNNINIINNITHENSFLVNNYNNGNIEPMPMPVSFNNNYIIYKNPIPISSTIYKNIFDSQTNKKKCDSGEKNYQIVSDIKDMSPSTPLKINEMGTPNFNLNETNKIFIKTEKLINESNIILEKSAFNKQIPNEMPFPYSNIKTHLYFTSSIKKPVKIISDEGIGNNMNLNNINNTQNEQNINSNNNNSNNNNNNNNNMNMSNKVSGKNFFQNMENLTPNKIMDFTDNSGTNTMMKFNNMVYSSNLKQELFNNSNGINIDLNNSNNVFSPSKNFTPFKISNANLDKMFFSNLNPKN